MDRAKVCVPPPLRVQNVQATRTMRDTSCKTEQPCHTSCATTSPHETDIEDVPPQLLNWRSESSGDFRKKNYGKDPRDKRRATRTGSDRRDKRGVHPKRTKPKRRPNRRKHVDIKFDSTKGYPGEGPEFEQCQFEAKCDMPTHFHRKRYLGKGGAAKAENNEEEGEQQPLTGAARRLAEKDVEECRSKSSKPCLRKLHFHAVDTVDFCGLRPTIDSILENEIVRDHRTGISRGSVTVKPIPAKRGLNTGRKAVVEKAQNEAETSDHYMSGVETTDEEVEAYKPPTETNEPDPAVPPISSSSSSGHSACYFGDFKTPIPARLTRTRASDASFTPAQPQNPEPPASPDSMEEEVNYTDTMPQTRKRSFPFELAAARRRKTVTDNQFQAYFAIKPTAANAEVAMHVRQLYGDKRLPRSYAERLRKRLGLPSTIEWLKRSGIPDYRVPSLPQQAQPQPAPPPEPPDFQLVHVPPPAIPAPPAPQPPEPPPFNPHALQEVTIHMMGPDGKDTLFRNIYLYMKSWLPGMDVVQTEEMDADGLNIFPTHIEIADAKRNDRKCRIFPSWRRNPLSHDDLVHDGSGSHNHKNLVALNSEYNQSFRGEMFVEVFNLLNAVPDLLSSSVLDEQGGVLKAYMQQCRHYVSHSRDWEAVYSRNTTAWRCAVLFHVQSRVRATRNDQLCAPTEGKPHFHDGVSGSEPPRCLSTV